MNDLTWLGDLDGFWDATRAKLKEAHAKIVDSHVKVAVRVRPLDSRERAQLDENIIATHDDGVTLTLDLTRIAQGMQSVTFAYDHVYGEDTTQMDVFESIGYDAVEHAFVGYNVSLFAYGQTGSGKTWTMMGIPGGADAGLIPRICRTIFHFVDQAVYEYDSYEASIEASYLEIYNEKPRDLLVDPKRTTVLQVRESPEVGVFVEGLSRHKVTTVSDVEMLIYSGTQYRTIAATKFNRESSRSHAVFELTLTQVFKSRTLGHENMTMQKRSRVSLIDLAGSERTGKIGNKGIVFDEGASINKSLTVLGRCIKALAKMKRRGGSGKTVAVPFRESILTWYLRESLAGNAKTTMLANISPADSNGNETYGTLRYAAEAKRIETSVHMNEDPIQRQLRQQQEEIMKLRQQLAELEESSSGKGLGGNAQGYADAEEREALLSALEELRRSSWDAVRNSARFSAEDLFQANQENLEGTANLEGSALGFPLLVTLTPDPMLSGKLRYSIQKPDSTSFCIGRAENMDLCLDGIGICEEHCEIVRMKNSSSADDDRHVSASNNTSASQDGDDSLKGGVNENEGEVSCFGLRVKDGAKVHLNGRLLEGAQAGRRTRLRVGVAKGSNVDGSSTDSSVDNFVEDDLENISPITLRHGDRLILGPCRFVAVFLAFDPEPGESDNVDAETAHRRRLLQAQGVPMSPDGQLWEYSAVVAEMMQYVGRVPRIFGNSTDASAEGRLWEELLRGLELVNQANEIAAEMMVNVEFCAAVTTTLPPEFDETLMHELPALGAHVIIHCRTVLPLNDHPMHNSRRNGTSPSSPMSLNAVPPLQFSLPGPPFRDSPSLSSATSPDYKLKSTSNRLPRFARVQSRDSDVDFLQTQNQRQQQGMALQRLFDVSIDAFDDFLAGLYDLYNTSAELCRSLNDEGDTMASEGDSDKGSADSDRMQQGRRSFGGAYPSSLNTFPTEPNSPKSALVRSPSARRQSLGVVSNIASGVARRSDSRKLDTGRRERYEYHPRRSRILRDIFRSVDEDEIGRINFSQLHRAMDQELSLSVRADQIRPLFDTFELKGDDSRLDLDEFVEFLVTFLRIKFGSTIAHLVTNTKAFADYLGISNVGGDDFSATSQHKRTLLAQAIASDASTSDGRRNSLDAFAFRQQPPSSSDSISLILPELYVPCFAESDRSSVVRRVLTNSLCRIFDCLPETVAVLENSANRIDDIVTEIPTTFTASVGGVHGGKLGKIIADFINERTEREQHEVSKVSPQAFSRLSGKSQMEFLTNTIVPSALPLTPSSTASNFWEERALQAEEKISSLEEEITNLRTMLANACKKPEGLSPFAEKLWASTSVAAAQLDSTRRAIALKSTSSLSSGVQSSPDDAKLREIVVALADLLLSANSRVSKALDDEGALKEYMKRLESKIAQVTKAMMTAQIAKQSYMQTPSINSDLKAIQAEHRESLNQLVHARLQLLDLVKDDAEGRLARARAQEASMEEDIIDFRAEKEKLSENIARNESHDEVEAVAQLSTLENHEKSVEEELIQLKSKIRELVVTAKNRQKSLEEDVNEAEEKLKRFNFGDSRQTISSIPMAGAQERTEAEQKEVTNTIDQKQKSDSLRVEFDQLKVKYSTLKERMIIAESAYRGLLNKLSSGAWTVSPSDDANTNNQAWGVANLKRHSARIGKRVNVESKSNTAEGNLRPPKIDMMEINSNFEDARGRVRDERALRDRHMRILSVERRVGESSSLENQAKELISESEDRIQRIGKIVEMLDSSQSKIKSLSPVAGSPSFSSGKDEKDGE